LSSKSDEVFLINGDAIHPLRSRPFRNGLLGAKLEDALQTLIEKQPNLLNGRQMEPGSGDPPRFALLRREMQVGDWSLDHLLVDQRGVLTFVEAKLLENPEARRAVIGQILDYAAYAAENWSNGRLRQLAPDADENLRAEFGDIDIEKFWADVETNLNEGNIRLVIAADELRPEVRRVIEYLNQQLRTIQVFGLEIRCYGEEPNAVVVPFLVGRTQQATAKQQTDGKSRDWTPEELREAYANLGNEVLGQRLTALLDWATRRNCLALPGNTIRPVFGLAGTSGQQIVSVSPAYIYPMLKEHRFPNGEVRIGFIEDLKKIGLFPQTLDVASIGEGKNLSTKLENFSVEQVSAFLEVLARYCRNS
jgi:hypothetical protein